MQKTLQSLLLFSLFSGMASAQDVKLVGKNGQEIITTISTSTNSLLITKSGSYKLTDLESATFERKEQKDQTIYDRLENAGVNIIFSGQPIIFDRNTLQKQEVTADELTTLKNSIEQFRQQRQIGKALQFVGIVGIVASGIWSANDTKGKDSESIKVMYGVSGAVWIVGFVIDWNAGIHLRVKK